LGVLMQLLRLDPLRCEALCASAEELDGEQ
jgi:hypothetical protein